ncbi:MAG: pyridoxamine 5'-phosphate oxidase family protein, partial [Ilumatobacter sp.]|nr:pyridoxamine 5'-phosphate oxidase family protein [Ilumatobacter sp.]
MSSIADIAPAFIETAHRIVWATVASVDPQGRPRSRVLHPIWEVDGDRLVGWIGTAPTPIKVGHLEHSPFVSVNYWDARHDIATAECHAELLTDDETCTRVWDMLKNG